MSEYSLQSLRYFYVTYLGYTLKHIESYSAKVLITNLRQLGLIDKVNINECNTKTTKL